MHKERYIAEVEKRLRTYFSASRDGYKMPAEDRHRLEGFIQGAIFMGFATSKQLSALMEDVHFAVFGKTIAERREEGIPLWQDSVVDYSKYDQPAYERKGR